MTNTIHLRKGEFLKLGTEGGVISRGIAWVTVPGFSEDFILSAGMSLPCCQADILLEALDSEVTIEIGCAKTRDCFSLGA